MNHNKPYFSNTSGVKMLMFMANIIPFCKKTSMGTRVCGICFKFLWFLMVAGVHLVEIHKFLVQFLHLTLSTLY